MMIRPPRLLHARHSRCTMTLQGGTVNYHGVEIPTEKIAEFCRRYHIRRLSLFGSVLRDDFRPESDIDMLVEFEPGHVPGLLSMAGLEMELSELLGRKVDLRTPAELSRHFRDSVLQEAAPQYVAA
jgi:uncharacterized protein